jgi:ankyrin repeat protein
LMAAALEGHPQVVELLLAGGAAVNARTADGQTPLMYAAINGSPDIVNLLLARGADIHARDQNGKTALAFASRLHHLQAKALLLQAGAK